MELHLVGGFLGSGKTTAIIAAAKSLMAQGKKVGVVTNDQGKYLVDTAFVRLSGVPAVEVTGGCFCCHYDDLEERLDQLRNDIQPDVVFAESVGSCGDLVATVVKPLLQLRGSEIPPSSLSTFTDSRLLHMHLRGEELPFSENVVYIFDKQIEEAPLLVINKIDLLEAAEVQELTHLAAQHYPDKTILLSNSLDSRDVEAWVRQIETDLQSFSAPPLEMDYQSYGAGEARLAWLDDELTFIVPEGRARQVAIQWITAILERLHAAQAAIGHLKFLLSVGGTEVKASFTTLEQPGWQQQIPSFNGTELMVSVNARVEIEAQQLHTILQDATQATVSSWSERNLAYFHPGFPNPTHRMR